MFDAHDPATLARLQFAFTVSFHIIFPTLSIGLASFLFLVEALWIKTGKDIYLQIYRFWIRVFALGFGIGVVTGVVLSFEFGLGFSRFSKFAGPAIGPMIALEVLTAFFLEAGFLGIMLFGAERVGRKLHLFATGMVALGTLISASWILSANSWMQSPAGVRVVGDHVEVVDWWHVVINPTWPFRLPHMIAAAYLTTSFLVAGIGAWYLLNNRHLAFARKTVSLGTGLASVFIGLQVFLGDILYGVMLEKQPSKMQAAEGYWDIQSEAPARYLWIIVPDQEAQRNTLEIGTPYLGSIWLTHSLTGAVAGLRNTPVENQPHMAFVFYGFRLMYVIAIMMFSVSAWSLWLRLRGRLYSSRWFLRVCVLLTPAGVLATLGGWYLAETGRQPWVVFGLLRTRDAASPVPSSLFGSSLLAFILTYSLLMISFLIIFARIIAKGPSAPLDSASDSSVTAHIGEGEGRNGG